MTKRIIQKHVLWSLFLIVIIIAVTLILCGRFDSTFAWLNGESVYIYSKQVDLGKRQPETKLIVTFKMRNLTNRDISVVGEKSSCSCAFTDHIPITVPPGTTVDVNVNVILPKQDSYYDQIVSFMVAEPERLTMHPVRIVATIQPSGFQ